VGVSLIGHCLSDGEPFPSNDALFGAALHGPEVPNPGPTRDRAFVAELIERELAAR